MLYEVKTNYGSFFVKSNSRTLHKHMWEYLRLWKNAGKPIAEALFCYGKVDEVHHQGLTNKVKALGRLMES